MIPLEQKIIALIKLGKIGFGEEDGKFTFTPKKGLNKAFSLKPDWYITGSTLVGLVDDCFTMLTTNPQQ